MTPERFEKLKAVLARRQDSTCLLAQRDALLRVAARFTVPLPVTDFDGQPFILNYSTLLSESRPSRQDGRIRKN